MYMPPGMFFSRSFTRLTTRVGLPHLGQSVLLVVSMTFFRSAVFAIFAILFSSNVTRFARRRLRCRCLLLAGVKRRWEAEGRVSARCTCHQPTLPYHQERLRLQAGARDATLYSPGSKAILHERERGVLRRVGSSRSDRTAGKPGSRGRPSGSSS